MFKEVANARIKDLRSILPPELVPKAPGLNEAQAAVYENYSVPVHFIDEEEHEDSFEDVMETIEIQAMNKSGGLKQSIEKLSNIISNTPKNWQLKRNILNQLFQKSNLEKIRAYIVVIKTFTDRRCTNEMLNQMVVSEMVNWTIVKELVYEEVLIISDFESTLAKIVSVGNNQYAFDFAVKFVRNFVISLEKIALSEIPNLMNVLQHS